jgi:hypothetical protein
MGARPRTRRSTPTSSPCSCVAACCPRPLCPLLRGAPPEICSGAACLSRAHGPSGWPISEIPIVRTTSSQDNLPELGQQLADTANRDGVAERVSEPAVQQRIEVDLTLIDTYDCLLTDLELNLVETATAHEAQTFDRLRSIPGTGNIFARVLLDEIHASHRFPWGQACVSSCRLVTCANASAGKRYGTSGEKIGHADLTWAVSEAAVLCLRQNPAGQRYLARLEHRHGQGNAVTVLAHQVARAVYDMLTRGTAFDRDKFFKEEWSGAGEPAASLAAEGSSRPQGALVQPQHGVKARA